MIRLLVLCLVLLWKLLLLKFGGFVGFSASYSLVGSLDCIFLVRLLFCFPSVIDLVYLKTLAVGGAPLHPSVFFFSGRARYNIRSMYAVCGCFIICMVMKIGPMMGLLEKKQFNIILGQSISPRFSIWAGV
jgi:hypothetical protein